MKKKTLTDLMIPSNLEKPKKAIVKESIKKTKVISKAKPITKDNPSKVTTVKNIVSTKPRVSKKGWEMLKIPSNKIRPGVLVDGELRTPPHSFTSEQLFVIPQRSKEEEMVHVKREIKRLIQDLKIEYPIELLKEILSKLIGSTLEVNRKK